MLFEDRLDKILEDLLLEKFVIDIGRRQWETDDSYGEEISTRLSDLKKPGKYDPSIGKGEGTVKYVFLPIFAYTPAEISRTWRVLDHMLEQDPNESIVVTGRRGYFYHRDGQLLPYRMASTADQKRARAAAMDSIIVTKVNGKPLSVVSQSALPAEIRAFFRMPEGEVPEGEKTIWLKELTDQLIELEHQRLIRSYDIGKEIAFFRGYIGIESRTGRYRHTVMLFSPRYAKGFYILRDKIDLPIENGNNMRWDYAIGAFANNQRLLKMYPHRDKKISFRNFIENPDKPQGKFFRRDFRINDIINFAKGEEIAGIDPEIFEWQSIPNR